MERIDLAIVVLAVVAVGGSVAGLLTYEGGLNTYIMNFEAHELAPKEESGSITGSGQTELTFTVDQANITQVDVEVEVSTDDPVLTDRDVEVEVESPNGSTDDDSGTIASDVGGGSATLTATVAVSEVPANHEEQATSADEVRQQAVRDHGHTMETGDWTVTLTIGGSSQDPATFDVTASMVVGYFDVHIEQQTPDVER